MACTQSIHIGSPMQQSISSLIELLVICGMQDSVTHKLEYSNFCLHLYPILIKVLHFLKAVLWVNHQSCHFLLAKHMLLLFNILYILMYGVLIQFLPRMVYVIICL